MATTNDDIAVAFKALVDSGQLSKKTVEEFTHCFNDTINTGYERYKTAGFDSLWKDYVVLLMALIDVLGELREWMDYKGGEL